MGEKMISVKASDFKQLVEDVSLLKNLLLYEGELTDWARKKLAESRKVDDSACVSHEEVKNELLQ